MKKLKNWLVCLLLAVCCLQFVACGGDKNNVNLNQKPNVAIEGDFQQTEVAQLSTTFGTKEAVAIDNFARYQVYISLETENYSQETNMAFELDEEGKLQGMAMKVSTLTKLAGVDVTCYYKNSMFYISSEVDKYTYDYKFDPSKFVVDEKSSIDFSTYTAMLDEMNITSMLNRLYSAMENSEYFNFEKTEDNTKFKVSTKADVILPTEMDCADLSIEIELAEGKLSQMKCVVGGDNNIKILLTKTDKKIKYPDFDKFLDITNMGIN